MLNALRHRHGHHLQRSRVVQLQLFDLLRSRKLSSDQPETKSVAADGGDMWAFARATRDEIKEVAAEATSKTVMRPVMTQFYTSRIWLWRQWSSTIVKAVLPREGG